MLFVRTVKRKSTPLQEVSYACLEQFKCQVLERLQCGNKLGSLMCPRDRETFRNIHETHMLEENVACNNKRRQHIKILYFVFAQNYLKIKTLEDADDMNKTSHKKIMR